MYTRAIKKWTNSQFEEFVSMLKTTGNGRVLEIITSTSSVVSKSSDVSSFEGYMLGDELEANLINDSLKPKGFCNLELIKQNRKER